MKEHPINEILQTSLKNINQLIDVNKVIGNPITLPDSQIGIPISKVVIGFGTGGSEFGLNKQKKSIVHDVETSEEIYPFGGGSGGGILIQPTAMMVFDKGKIKLLKIDEENELLNKVADTIKDIIKK